MRDLTREVRRLDLVHAAPVRFRPLRARSPRTVLDRLSTPVEIREIDPGAPVGIGSVYISGTACWNNLVAFEGGTWAPLLGPGDARPVRKDNFLAYLRGEGVMICSDAIPRQLRWTPLHAWRKSEAGTPRHVGDTEAVPPAALVLDDARDEARSRVAAFVSRNILLCGGEVLVRARGPFLSVRTMPGTPTSHHPYRVAPILGKHPYQATVVPDLRVWPGVTLDELIAPDSLARHALATQERIDREEGRVTVGEAASLVTGATMELRTLPGMDASSDVLDVAASWGILQVLNAVGRALGNPTVLLDDARTVRGLRDGLDRWAMRAAVSGIAPEARAEALQATYDLARATLQRLPPLRTPCPPSEAWLREELSRHAAWLADDLLPRTFPAPSVEDADALLSLAR